MKTWLNERSFQLVDLLAVESADYIQLIRDLGAGEAASIAISANRRSRLVIDDVQATRAAEARGVTCLSSGVFLQRFDGGEFGLL